MSRHQNQQRNYQAAQALGQQQSNQVQAVSAGLTAAHFTEPELRELRKLCRDAKNSGEGHELCHRYLESALARAAGGGK